MSYITDLINNVGILPLIMALFSVIASVDRIFGNKWGLGKEFEKGVHMLGVMGLSMAGMIIISPFIAQLSRPLTEAMAKTPLDPSIIPASLFANDMGGDLLARELALNEKIGFYNGLVVSSMMGCTISFTIPFGLNAVNKEYHKEVLLGFLCGIVTIPVGCFVGGIVAGVPIITLLINSIPLVILALIISAGLLIAPGVCIKIFDILGKIINIIIIIGLALGIVRYLTGIEIIKGLYTYEGDAGRIILGAAATMTGAFPLIFVLTKALNKPLSFIGRKIGINPVSAMGFVSSLASSALTFPKMPEMNKKGIVMNSAFCISGAFLFAAHLSYTLTINPDYVPAVMIGKVTAGVLSIFAAVFMYGRIYKNKDNENTTD